MSGIGDIKDDVVIIFKERIAGPIGYVIFSFVAYNWSWFYFLIFSKKTAEDKISIIKNDFDLLHGIGWPLVFGAVLAISTPFIKVGMIHLTALARKLEDKKNYQIKNFLDDYIEGSKLELIKKKQEITEREAKIHSLIERKTNIESEITKATDILDELRKEDRESRTNLNNIRRESDSLQAMIAEYKVTNEGFRELREKISLKSNEVVRLKKQLVILKNNIAQIQSYLSGDVNYFEMLSQDQVYHFKKALTDINEKIKSLDDGTYEIIQFTQDYDGPGEEVNISTLRSFLNWQDFVSLLEKNNLPTDGFISRPDTSTSIRFKRVLTAQERNEVTSLYREYLENH
ncbi:hypothetical protein [Serratia marcescens]|uniref:hypothetical protein n=1 Tax=Serratia marcescens TaxID=615 RepID=UPI000A3B40D9|nr:hypothetical protein [Serratia marcescens]AVN33275.1 hypothetical protein AM470_07835 [Serratia marcescens]OUI66742.1 hypothetical protein AZZ99_001005 [Serratia marcescens]